MKKNLSQKTYKDLLREGAELLRSEGVDSSVDLDVRLLLGYCSGLSREQFILESDRLAPVSYTHLTLPTKRIV